LITSSRRLRFICTTKLHFLIYPYRSLSLAVTEQAFVMLIVFWNTILHIVIFSGSKGMDGKSSPGARLVPFSFSHVLHSHDTSDRNYKSVCPFPPEVEKCEDSKSYEAYLPDGGVVIGTFIVCCSTSIAHPFLPPTTYLHLCARIVPSQQPTKPC
jgi:hypothetical protein